MASILHTDKYKPAMALAGFPLRRETFTLTLRKGGPFLVPFDLAERVRRLRPEATDEDFAYLAGLGLRMTEAYRRAIAEGELEVQALPRGSWFLAGEPVLSVTGPSALVSTLEATLLSLRFPIQIATLARCAPETLRARIGFVTCDEEREIVAETLDAVGVSGPFAVRVDTGRYQASVHARARELVEIAGDPARLMEAGLRAATCVGQHRLALEACRAAGITATSHLGLARALGMTAAGTTGHEHTQRWGSDRAAFAAVRDLLPGEVAYLLDTYSTRKSGLPAALATLRARPDRAASVRFDCEATMEDDYRAGIAAFRAEGVAPGINLGGGFDADRTRRFEALREELGWPAARQRMMYGNYLVAPHVSLPTRSDVGAVYKLSESGGRATMKFSDDPGKASLPGRPVVLRAANPTSDRPFSLIAQDGEEVPPGYRRLTDREEGPATVPPSAARVEISPATRALVARLNRLRRRGFERAVA